MSEPVCETCGSRLPDRKGGRKFCSERCRREQYSGSCVDCGGRTDGHDGPGRAALRCAACRRVHQRANAQWTPDTVVAAMRRWAEENGRPPSARHWRVQGDGYWPPTCIVQDVFGTWSAGIAAAGFEPLPMGRPKRKAAA